MRRIRGAGRRPARRRVAPQVCSESSAALCPFSCELYRFGAPGYTSVVPVRRGNFGGGKAMRLKLQGWSVLLATGIVGLLGVTAVAAAGEQFLPILAIREGALKAVGIPR